MAIRHLYLVRHGQYHTERDGPAWGHLTALGRRQARATGRHLRGIPVDVIHSSDLPRALESTEALAASFPRVPLERHRLLREVLPVLHFDLLEESGVTRSAPPGSLRSRLWADPDYRAQLSRRFRRVAGWAPDETRAARVFRRFFKSTRGRDRHEILMAHGNLIRYLVCRVLTVLPEAWLHMSTHHCGVTEVRVLPGDRPRLVTFNSHSHLPLATQT